MKDEIEEFEGEKEVESDVIVFYKDWCVLFVGGVLIVIVVGCGFVVGGSFCWFEVDFLE